MIGLRKFINSNKYANFKRRVRDYYNRKISIYDIFSIHKEGFLLNDWQVLGIDANKSNYYLSSEDYYNFHPINGQYSKFIDDKLTIKYIFYGTNLNELMPKYYYLIDKDGLLFPMVDNLQSKSTSVANDILALLKREKELALKKVSGSIGLGFYKMEYKNDLIYVNDQQVAESECISLLNSLKEYLVCEYLKPHPYIAEYWPATPNTIRHLVGRVGNEWRIIKSFIRFGTSKSGNVENFNKGGILCYIDENGHFENGYQLTTNPKGVETTTITEHPDTKKRLTGDIPLWDELIKITGEIERLIPETKYLGIDYVITDQSEVKLLEINSLTSLDTLQLDCSILKTENGKWFFSSLKKRY